MDIKVKRKFKVGERVEFINGRGFDIEVVKVLDNDKYLVDYKIEHENYGKKTIKESKNNECHWYQIKKESPNFDHKFNKREQNYKIRISFHNTHLRELVRSGLEGHIDFNPSYQRDLVWKKKDKEQLIRSIFEGIEIGKFAFISLDYGKDHMYEILDGKQRLSTLIEFVTDQFKYEGKYFSELHQEDKWYFLDYSVTRGETREELTEKEKIQYFLRLNTRGVDQTAKHIKDLEERLQCLK